MKQSTNRSLLYGLVGGYLLYLAYELLQNRIKNVPTTMAPWLAILFIVLFTGIGITLLVYAWKIWKQGREDQDQNPVDLAEPEGEDAAGSGDNGNVGSGDEAKADPGIEAKAGRGDESGSKPDSTEK